MNTIRKDSTISTCENRHKRKKERDEIRDIKGDKEVELSEVKLKWVK